LPEAEVHQPRLIAVRPSHETQLSDGPQLIALGGTYSMLYALQFADTEEVEELKI
jgi:hypothetical protein